MTNPRRMRFKAALEAKRQELVRDIRVHAAELAIDEGERDPIDQVQCMNRRDDAAVMLRRLSRTLSDVDKALCALSEGRYGACVECAEPISLKRLEIIPWASCCVGCQEFVERRESMHAADPPLPFDGDLDAA